MLRTVQVYLIEGFVMSSLTKDFYLQFVDTYMNCFRKSIHNIIYWLPLAT